MKGKVYCIGEALIDFIATQKGTALKNSTAFEKVAGGAPANVSASIAKLGGKSSLITKLGNDAFGDYLISILENSKVEVDKIYRTDEANTALAFVSLKNDGDRDFSFYRNPSADLLLTEQEIKEEWFTEEDYLHFGSVDLVESPMKYAHKKAIQAIKERGGLVSFDPNVRLSLWKEPTSCRNAIHEFLPLTHLLKISDEELEFITEIPDKEEAIRSLFVGDVQVVLYTKGANGAELYTKQGHYDSPGFTVQVADTTGAGDAFMGACLYKLMENGVTVDRSVEYIQSNHQDMLMFANACGAYTASVMGAIPSLPGMGDIVRFLGGQTPAGLK
ncbi:MAG: carbohydrate kinase [Cytobacillus gottheilii]|uniref:carbohydrate kinase family protein n=1 Tax=Cytobacillus gottheilii TaxID=859144 RepID=UPI000834F78C|nr:carbohydrate kinase [Cytobacillus gottheilii]